VNRPVGVTVGLVLVVGAAIVGAVATTKMRRAVERGLPSRSTIRYVRWALCSCNVACGAMGFTLGQLLP
jgi:hypothetical protein